MNHLRKGDFFDLRLNIKHVDSLGFSTNCRGNYCDRRTPPHTDTTADEHTHIHTRTHIYPPKQIHTHERTYTDRINIKQLIKDDKSEQVELFHSCEHIRGVNSSSFTNNCTCARQIHIVSLFTMTLSICSRQTENWCFNALHTVCDQ